MFRSIRARELPQHIDLSTVRETLQYIHDDMRRAAGLEKLSAALAEAIREAEAAEALLPSPVDDPVITARFVPRHL